MTAIIARRRVIEPYHTATGNRRSGATWHSGSVWRHGEHKGRGPRHPARGRPGVNGSGRLVWAVAPARPPQPMTGLIPWGEE